MKKVSKVTSELEDKLKEFRRIEGKLRLKLRESHREFIREGPLWRMSIKGNKPRKYQFFLFNDIARELIVKSRLERSSTSVPCSTTGFLLSFE